MSSAVLVTGGGGFVGSAVVRRFVLGGARFFDGATVDHVVALLRPGGSTERLSDLPQQATWSIERADVADLASIRAVLDRVRPRAIVHAALDPRMYLQDDQQLVRDPLDAMLVSLAGVRGGLFVHVGSAWVLESGNALDESTPLDPFGPYARNKATEEALLATRAADAGVPWMNLRLFNVFGRYEKPSRLLPTLVATLSRGKTAELSHGEQLRDFNDVDVVAQAFVHALAVPEEAHGAVYHIGSGRSTTVREFAFLVAEVTGSRDLIHFGVSNTLDQGVPALVADPSRAKNVLGWEADLDLEARIRDAVMWWLARLGMQTGVR